jgi:hypothetical protein
MKSVLTAITLIAVTASVLYSIQGGFGAGHGDFDKALLILGLPWTFVPWPAFIIKHDVVWLVGLPFIMNIAVALVVVAVVRMAGRASKPSF